MPRKKGKGVKKAGKVKKARRGRKARGAKFSALVQQSLDKLRSDAESLALDAYIGNLSRYADKTLGQFLAAIAKDGAKDALMSIGMSRIASAMGAPARGKRGRKKAAVAAGGRLSKEAMAKLQQDILGFIKTNPDCKRKDIAKSLGLPTKRLFSAMKGLMGDGKLVTKGAKAGMTYSLKKD